MTLLQFRIERLNDAGDARPPVQVEVRSLSPTGSVADGDRVRVPGPWRRGDMLRPSRFRNLTTDTDFAAHQPGTRLTDRILDAVWPFIFLGMLAV